MITFSKVISPRSLIMFVTIGNHAIFYNLKLLEIVNSRFSIESTVE